DLEHHALLATRGGRADDRAQRACDPPLAADHLADVVLGHVQLQDNGPFALDLLDADLVGLVDEPPRQVLDDLFAHRPFALSSRWTVSEGCAPFESQSLMRSSLSSIVDGSVWGL